MITVSTEKDKKSKVIDAIAEILLRQGYDDYPGLINGNGSIVLFLAYYYKWIDRDSKILTKVEGLLYKIFEQLNTYEVPNSFATGYAGIGWLLHKLIELEIIDGEYRATVEQISMRVDEDLISDLESMDLDLLYGFIGKYIFLHDAGLLDAKLRKQVELSVAKLDFGNIASIFTDAKAGINLGLAHGCAGLGLFLLNYFPLSVEALKHIESFYVGVEKYIDQYKGEAISIFPNSIAHETLNGMKIPQSQSRYAWCYGDLGILFFLSRLNKASYDNLSGLLLNKLIDSCNRRNITNAHIAYMEAPSCYDIGFCHGLSGISYLQHKINSRLSRERCLTTNEYWDQLFIENLSVYLKNENFNRNSPSNSYNPLNVLEDIAGAGLVLLSVYTGDYSWGQCLMLNN